jgi:hypothetical protein
LLAVAATVACFAVMAASLGWPAYQHLQAKKRATSVADGRIVQDDIGEYGDIRVRWRDRSGADQVQRFGIYDVNKYRKGRVFRVRYDPDDPKAKAFPADPDETSAEDDLLIPLELSGVAAFLVLLGWGVRGLAFRRAARRNGHPMAGTLMRGQPIGPASYLGASTWIALSAPESTSAGNRWQRVMWHPALASVPDRATVIVHGDTTGRRRVVVELPGGELLVPAGRLRRKPPSSLDMSGGLGSTVSLDELFIVPTGVVLRPAGPWWRRALIVGLVGAALGAVAGVLIAGSPLAILPFAAGAAAVVINAWALNDGRP